MSNFDFTKTLLNANKQYIDMKVSDGTTHIHGWNDLKDKPFYDNIEILLEWDGNIDGIDPVIGSDYYYYRVCDAIPEEEIIGSTIYFTDGTEININSVNRFNYYEKDSTWRIFHNSAQLMNIQIPDSTFTVAGLYSTSPIDYPYICKISNGEIKTLDKKYLPEGIGGGVTSWNDLEDRPFYETEAVEEVFVPEITIPSFERQLYFSGCYYYHSQTSVDYYVEFEMDRPYTVIWDGVRYDNVMCQQTIGGTELGSTGRQLSGAYGEVAEYPFGIYIMGSYEEGNNTLHVNTNDSLQHTVKVIDIIKESEIITIDPKFLPEHLQFGEEKTLTPFWNEETFDFMTYTSMPYYFYNQSMPNNLLIVGDTYTVVWDGIEYPDLVCEYGGYNGYECIGATMSTDGDGSVGNEYPFSINVQKYMGDDIIAYIATNDDSATHTIAIYKQDENIKTLDPKYLPEGIGGGSYVQADWNINDETDPAYIKNRLFWSEAKIILQDKMSTKLPDTDEGAFAILELIEGIEIDERYIVTYNGINYECVANTFDSGDGVIFTSLGDSGLLNGEVGAIPFFMIITSQEQYPNVGVGAIILDSTGSLIPPTISIETIGNIHRLDNKYLDIFEDNLINIAKEKIVTNNANVSETGGGFSDLTKNDVYAGQELIVFVDGNKYNMIVENSDSLGLSAGTMIGNVTILLQFYDSKTIIVVDDGTGNLETPHTASVWINKGKLNTIDPKYLPEGIGNGVTSWNDLTDKPFEVVDNTVKSTIPVEATALILSSPNGTRFQITIGDDGVLTATEITV
ncbi:MAG: hypothetical protein IKY26_06410 [Erysipelotrichaceae bacterium]|nr:hypothetical protein [Erysipelotrichaceae bacterium]